VDKRTRNHHNYWRLRIYFPYLRRYNRALDFPKRVTNCLYGVPQYPSNGATFGSFQAWLKLPERALHESGVSVAYLATLSATDDRASIVAISVIKMNLLIIFRKITDAYCEHYNKRVNILCRKIESFLMFKEVSHTACSASRSHNSGHFLVFKEVAHTACSASRSHNSVQFFNVQGGCTYSVFRE
jgi:hypothetical protein